MGRRWFRCYKKLIQHCGHDDTGIMNTIDMVNFVILIVTIMSAHIIDIFCFVFCYNNIYSCC